MARRFGESWWQEVALLLVALEDPPVFERFMGYVVETKAFPANLEIALQCMDEAVEVSLEPFVDLVRQ